MPSELSTIAMNAGEFGRPKHRTTMSSSSRHKASAQEKLAQRMRRILPLGSVRASRWFFDGPSVKCTELLTKYRNRLETISEARVHGPGRRGGSTCLLPARWEEWARRPEPKARTRTTESQSRAVPGAPKPQPGQSCCAHDEGH